ncbi:D-2-hydroxyacid dehydrogenase [Stakelama tenebrarum]|uniref:D-2-hydroxyacid dehydrogenase n=1 Tax=Stakelama tenebrarum TaxID=2711215 RepID=A0A6G6Y715_9SPHN|nr:D-2-hydroxyacid dehydrogenase [Sphingosinithalassobacter tenebrarum]QIG80641.1 D-2-hydroxyacid dehydrogenase [Sphingosinithalassobacter tenebrarum]
MKAVLPALARPLLEPKLPDGLSPHWFSIREEAEAMVVDADIAWIDLQNARASGEVLALGKQLKWVSTLRAGVDFLDLDQLKALGAILTNGNGINAEAVAEYAMLGVLAAAKRFDEVVRMADRHQWTETAPGQVELYDSTALVIGYGTIGRMIGDRLAGFDVAVTGVTRSGRDGTLTPDQWRERLSEYDWVILAAPATGETAAMFGADEFAAMKSSAWIVNVGRGDMIDQEALVEALEKRRIAGAFLDTVTPEPLPPEHPLWDVPNCIHSMHLSGRSQTRMFQRAAALFLENCHAFLSGTPMRNIVDLDAGY